MEKTYEQLATELSEKMGWKTSMINGNLVFWIPWEQTGAFCSLEDAKENSIIINDNNEVSWVYDKRDLIELIENFGEEIYHSKLNIT